MGIENINYEKPEQYIKNLNELSGTIDLLLAEFSKIYVVYNMNPNNPEYQQQYANIISNINQVQSKLFSISNDVQVSIDDITQKLLEINVLISIERRKNRELKRKLGLVEDKNNSSYEMIYNYKQIYNINYLRNWGLFLSTALCILAISKVYKNQGV
jgi:succinyl-CoA synthetase beta subunit